jgi:hypothetical protein
MKGRLPKDHPLFFLQEEIDCYLTTNIKHAEEHNKMRKLNIPLQHPSKDTEYHLLCHALIMEKEGTMSYKTWSKLRDIKEKINGKG